MRILKICLITGALLSALFLTGCATVTRGRTEQLTVLSEPSAASVRLSNGNTGVTPATFTVPRKGDVYVTVFKDGYETAGLIIPAKLSGAGTVGFLGNALIGGIIGGGVDVITGATLSHEPNPVVVKLVPKSAPAPVPAPSPGPPSPVTTPSATSRPAEAAPPSPSSAPVQSAASPAGPVAPAPVTAPSEPAKPPIADAPAASPAAQPAPPAENKPAVGLGSADPAKQ